MFQSYGHKSSECLPVSWINTELLVNVYEDRHELLT